LKTHSPDAHTGVHRYLLTNVRFPHSAEIVTCTGRSRPGALLYNAAIGYLPIDRATAARLLWQARRDPFIVVLVPERGR
jgi:hypothetical protein